MKSVSTIVFCVGLIAGLAFWGCTTDNSPSNPESADEYGDITGKVYGTDGAPIENANVSAGGVSAQTDLDGAYTLSDVPVGDHILSASSNGLTSAHRNLNLVAEETLNASDMVLAELEPVGLDGATGGTATTSDGVCSVEFGAEAFVAAGEKSYTGDVTVQINAFLPVDDTFPAVFPGDFEGVREDGTTTMFASYGFVTVNLASADKAPLNLAPGATAHLSLDIGEEKAQDAPATIPMWYYDEDEGLWHEDGESVLQGTVYVGEVSHFSSWNWDLPWSQTCYVQGYVKDEFGNPIYRARVNSQVVGGRWGWWGDHQVRSDENGFFSVRARINDEADFWASMNGMDSEVIRRMVDSNPYVLDVDLVITTVNDTK